MEIKASGTGLVVYAPGVYVDDCLALFNSMKFGLQRRSVGIIDQDYGPQDEVKLQVRTYRQASYSAQRHPPCTGNICEN